MICSLHPHSSPETAAKCWEARLKRKVKRMERYMPTMLPRFKQVRFEPPVTRGLVTYFYGSVITAWIL